MLVVLEGCDGAGKTELATFLSKVLKADIIHCSTHTPNDLEFFKNIIDAAKGKRNVIADRFCYGQFIYQQPDERPLAYGRFTAEELLYVLETSMLANKAKVIYVTAPADVIKSRLRARGEELINGLTVEEVLKRYDDVIHKSMLPWIVYNTGGERNV